MSMTRTMTSRQYVLSVLVLVHSVTLTDGGCSKFWIDQTLVTKETLFSLKANVSSKITSFAPNTTVELSCWTDGLVIVGSNISRCLPNDQWNSKPNCTKPLAAPHKRTLPWDIIGGSIGCGVGFIAVATTIIVCACRRKKKRKNRASNAVHQKDFADENHDFNNRVYTDPAGLTQTRHDHHYLSNGSLDFRSIDGVSIVGSTNSVIASSHQPIFKVWTCRRARRKFLRADNLFNLQKKAAVLYQYPMPVRIVLEEDGTQIDTDDALMACLGRTLVVLSDNEKWRDLDGKSTVPVQRITFDVCSYDRSKRKLILAENLRDLTFQAGTFFGYNATEVCLESDGTAIGDNEILMSMSSQIFMALGVYHTWQPGTLTEAVMPEATEAKEGIKMSDFTFKVWTVDFTRKQIIRAKNCIELHVQAAKALGLSMPVQIRVKDEDIIISTDILLQSNVGKTLIVSHIPQHMASLQSKEHGGHVNVGYSPEAANYQYQAANKNVTYHAVDNSVVYPMRESRDLNQSNQRQSGPIFIQQERNPYNEPDIISSTQIPEVMPNRYGYKPKSERIVGEQGESRYEKVLPRNYGIEKDSMYPDANKLHHVLDVGNENKPIQASNFTKSVTPDVKLRSGERLDIGQNYPKRGARPNQTVGWNSKSEEPHYSYVEKRSENQELPYMDLTPTKQLNLGGRKSFEARSQDDSLPYSDLSPVHKSPAKNPKNNFDMMRNENLGLERAEQARNNFNGNPIFLKRQSSFLVTGGAKQSSKSDVLF